MHYVKSVRIRSYSGPYFGILVRIGSISPYLVPMRENADQNSSEYGHFLCSGAVPKQMITRLLQDTRTHPHTHTHTHTLTHTHTHKYPGPAQIQYQILFIFCS